MHRYCRKKTIENKIVNMGSEAAGQDCIGY